MTKAEAAAKQIQAGDVQICTLVKESPNSAIRSVDVPTESGRFGILGMCTWRTAHSIVNRRPVAVDRHMIASYSL